MVASVWSDLTSIANFLFSTLSQVANLVMSTILVVVVGLFILRLVIKFFKRLVG